MKYSYRERLEKLVNVVKESNLNDGEFHMLYTVLDLSKDRNNFNKQYNEKIDGVLKKRGSLGNE